MPKTTMHEDSFTEGPENDVGAAGNIGRVQPVTIAESPKRLADCHLRLGILRPHQPHLSTSLLPRQWIAPTHLGAQYIISGGWRILAYHQINAVEFPGARSFAPLSHAQGRDLIVASRQPSRRTPTSRGGPTLHRLSARPSRSRYVLPAPAIVASLRVYCT